MLLGLEMGPAQPLQVQRRGAYDFESAIPTTANQRHQAPHPSWGRYTLATTCSYPSMDMHTHVRTHAHTTSPPSSLNYLAQVQPPQTSILLHYPHTLTTVYVYQVMTRHAPTKTGTTETQNTQPPTFSFITCTPRFPQPQPTPTTTHRHPP